ncbi:MAG: AbrB/MazE/SpoVT family DNA-binding domain-containing protein, partial [Wenzhouxiangella sp.]
QSGLWHRYYGRYNVSLFVTGVSTMTRKLKLTAIGNSTGVVLPKDLLEKLRVEKGDELMVLETPDGIRLTSYDPEFARQMEVAEKIMREDRDLLRRLAE